LPTGQKNACCGKLIVIFTPAFGPGAVFSTNGAAGPMDAAPWVAGSGRKYGLRERIRERESAEQADKAHAVACGGSGGMHKTARWLLLRLALAC